MKTYYSKTTHSILPLIFSLITPLFLISIIINIIKQHRGGIFIIIFFISILILFFYKTIEVFKSGIIIKIQITNKSIVLCKIFNKTEINYADIINIKQYSPDNSYINNISIKSDQGKQLMISSDVFGNFKKIVDEIIYRINEEGKQQKIFETDQTECTADHQSKEKISSIGYKELINCHNEILNTIVLILTATVIVAGVVAICLYLLRRG